MTERADFEQIARQGLRLARELVDSGVPVIVCRPRPGAVAGSGNDLVPVSRRWSRLSAEDTRAALERFRPGIDALALVGGHGIDLVDVDTKSGGSVDPLGPFTYHGITETPSGGRHYVVTSTGVGKITGLKGEDGRFVGDYVGGTRSGAGRLLGYLPGSVRPKYPGRIYTEAEDAPWDVAGALAGPLDVDLLLTLLEVGGRNDSERLASKVGGEYVDDSPVRDPALGLHPYAARSLEGEIAKLKRCQDEGWGTNWDQTTFAVACNLVEFANSNWSGYSLEDAHGDLLRHAPRDEDFNQSDHETKWESAVKTIGDAGRPYPGDDSAADDFSGPVRTPASDLYNEKSLADAHLGERVGREYLRGRFIAWGRNRWARWDGKRWDLHATETSVLDMVRRSLMDVRAVELARADKKRDIGLQEAGSDQSRAAEVLQEHTKKVKQLETLLSSPRITAVMRLSRGVVEHDISDFDAEATHNFLNVGNGVVDLRTGELTEHDPGWLFTQVSEVNYLPEAHHDDWDKALTALPEEVARWMQLRFGQAATGKATADDVVPILQGQGENAKTTLLLGVKKALGEFSSPVPEKVVLAGPNDHPTELFALKGVRLAFIEELPEGNYLNIARLKRVVGTETGITARAIGQDNVTWDPTHSLMVTTNYDLRVNETDHGTWRRLALVRFPYTFDGSDPERPRDATLRDRIRDGKDGQHEAVLAWIVEGARRFFEEGLSTSVNMPETVKKDTMEWRFKSNSCVEFIDEHLVLDESSYVRTTDVYELFVRWNASRGSAPLADRTFWARAQEHEWFQTHLVEKKRVKTAGKTIHTAPGNETVKTLERVLAGVRFDPEIDWLNM